MTEISFSGSIIEINGKNISLSYDISEAYLINGIIVILLAPGSYIGKEKNLKNLVAYNTDGEMLWEADFPQNYKSDYYWKIKSKNPLIVNSFSSYECEIDLNTGRVKKSDFYK